MTGKTIAFPCANATEALKNLREQVPTTCTDFPEFPRLQAIGGVIDPSNGIDYPAIQATNDQMEMVLVLTPEVREAMAAENPEAVLDNCLTHLDRLARAGWN